MASDPPAAAGRTGRGRGGGSPELRASAVLLALGATAWANTAWSFLLGLVVLIAADRWDARHPRRNQHIPLIAYVMALVVAVTVIVVAGVGLGLVLWSLL